MHTMSPLLHRFGSVFQSYLSSSALAHLQQRSPVAAAAASTTVAHIASRAAPAAADDPDAAAPLRAGAAAEADAAGAYYRTPYAGPDDGDIHLRRANGRIESAIEGALLADAVVREQLVERLGLTVHRVRLTSDRRTAHILWDANPGAAAACELGLRRCAFRLRRHIAKVTRARNTPFLEFRHDHLPPRQASVAAAIERVEREAAVEAAGGAAGGGVRRQWSGAGCASSSSGSGSSSGSSSSHGYDHLSAKGAEMVEHLRSGAAAGAATAAAGTHTAFAAAGTQAAFAAASTQAAFAEASARAAAAAAGTQAAFTAAGSQAAAAAGSQASLAAERTRAAFAEASARAAAGTQSALGAAGARGAAAAAGAQAAFASAQQAAAGLLHPPEAVDSAIQDLESRMHPKKRHARMLVQRRMEELAADS